MSPKIGIGGKERRKVGQGASKVAQSNVEKSGKERRKAARIVEEARKKCRSRASYASLFLSEQKLRSRPKKTTVEDWGWAVQ